MSGHTTDPGTGLGPGQPGAPASSVWNIPAPLLNGIGGAALLGMAGWLWLGASDIDGAGNGLMGPDGFPRAVAILLAATSLMVVAQAVRSAVSGAQPAPIQIRRPVSVLLAIVLVTAYPVLVTQLHYYVGTAIWLVPFLWVSGMRKPTGIALTTGGFLLFTKVLFQMVLGTPLP